MWNRQELKYRARGILAPNYWEAFLVSSLAAVITGVELAPGIRNFVFFHGSRGLHFSWGLGNFGERFWVPNVPWVPSVLQIGWFWGMALFGTLFALLYLLFIAGPVRVGQCRYYIATRNGREDFRNLFFIFRSPHYKNVVYTLGRMYLSVFLWSLLFVLPGIYKFYSYSQVPYILAENPSIPPERALEVSEGMMGGERMNAFFLALSFLGWLLAGSLLFGIGIFFVFPYTQTTFTEFYGVLRYKAISHGFCTPGELSEHR